MVNYQLGKIYILESCETNEVYIGSTAQIRLSKRLSNHKDSYRRFLKGKYHYMTSFRVSKYPDCRGRLLETYPSNSKEELESREDYWIKQYPNCVNKKYNLEGVRPINYTEDTQFINEQNAKYNLANKDYIKRRSANYYDKNKDKISKKSAIYRNKPVNKAMKKITNSNYRKNEYVKTRRKRKVLCLDCGLIYCKDHRSRHNRTKMHQDAINGTFSESITIFINNATKQLKKDKQELLSDMNKYL